MDGCALGCREMLRPFPDADLMIVAQGDAKEDQVEAV